MADLNTVLAQLQATHPEIFTPEDPFAGMSLQDTLNVQPTNISTDDKFDWDMSNVVNNLVSGFVEGFTTVPASEFTKARTNDPVNRIVNSIGSLMGFVGFIPGAGTLGKIGVTGLLKSIGLTKSAKLLSVLPKSFHVTSVPMGIANLVTKKLQQTGAYASLDAIKFLSKGSLGRDLLEGGLHLGIASGVGAAPIYDLTPQTFIDKRLEGFTQGAIFGAGNRAIGNVFSRGGKFDLAPLFTGKTTEQILKMTDRAEITKLLGKGDLVNKGVRALSSGLIFGMPSTLKGYPLELQVYDYLLNAYFGGREMSKGQREALNLSMPYLKAGRRDKLVFPEKTFKDKWEDISPEARQELKIQSEIELHGSVNEYTTSAYAEVQGVLNKIAAIDADLAAGKITGEYARNMAKDAIIEDQVLRDPENPEAAVEKAREIIYENATKKEELERSTSNFLSLLKDIESATPENLNDEYYQFAKRLESTFESLSNGSLSSKYLEPFEKLGSEISKQMGIEKKDFNSRTSILEKINKLALQHLSKDKTIYDFERAVKGIFKLKELPKDIRLELIHSYEYLQQSKERPTYVFDSQGENKIRLQDPETKNGLKRGMNIEPRAFLDKPEFLDGTLGELKRYVDNTGEEIDVQKAVREGLTTHAELLEEVYKIDKGIIGGKKTDSNLLTGKFLVDEANTAIYLEDILKVPLVADNYNKGLADFLKQGGTNKLVYDRNFANNVELIKRFNFPKSTELPSKVISDMLAAGDFIMKASALNKRFQVFDDHALRINQEVVSKIMGKDKMSFRILNANNKDGSPNLIQNEGDDFWINVQAKDDKGNSIIKRKKLEAHRDGGTWLSKKAYEAMAVSLGFDPKSTSMKGIGAYAGYDDLGGILFKHAFHKAPAELDAIMAKDGLDVIAYDTTVKQAGLRDKTDWVFDGEKFNYKTDVKYEIPWDSFTVSTVDYNPTGYDKITIPQQVLKNIDDPVLRKAVIDKYITPALEGIPEENTKFQSYIDAINSGQDVTKLESTIDAAKLSKANKIAVLKLNKDSKLWKDIVIEEVLKLKVPEDQILEELRNETDYWADSESTTMVKDFMLMQGSGRKMINSIIGQDFSGLHPDTMQIPGLKDYYASALKRWFFTEIVHPKSDYSWKAVAKPLDTLLQHKLGIKQGEFYYGEANKILKAEITINGEKVRGQLGKLWDKYGKSHPEAFRFLMERVPMDSRAGARAGIFKGFWGEGSGIYTHPEDDIFMGGADKDIDSYFVHHDMPKEIIDYYESHKNQWKRDVNGKKVLVEAKQDPAFVNLDDQVDNRIFDPMSNLKMNQVAYEGNALLGQLLATGNRLKVAHKEYAKQKFIATGYDKNDKLSWVAKVNPDITDIEKFIYDSVNFSADAADGKTLYDAEHLRRVAYSKMFTDITKITYTKDGKKISTKITPFSTYTTKDGEVRYQFYPSQEPAYKDITKLDQLAKGIKYRDNKPVKMSFDELAIELDRFQRGIQDTPYESVMGEVLNTMSKVDLTNFDNTGWLGKHYTKWLEKFDAMFSIPNSNMRKEAERYLGRYIMNNVSQRQGALKKYHATLERIYPGDPERQKQAFDIFKSDSLRNDMLDYEAYFNVVKKGAELESLLLKTTGYTAESVNKEIKDIIRSAEKFRFHIRGIREAVKDNGLYHLKGQDGKKLKEPYTKQQLDADLMAYYRTLDTGGERASQIRRGYFEHLIVGRAEPRTESLASMQKDPLKNIYDMAGEQTPDGKKKFPMLREVNPKTFAKDIELNGGSPKDIKRALYLQRLYTDVKAINKRYFQSTNDTFFYNHPIVQDITIAEKAKIFHELTQATFKPVWSDDQSIDIAKIKNDTPIDNEARATGKEVISNDFSSNRNLWTEIFADMKDASINPPLNDKELNDLGDRMFKILDKNSHLRASLPDRYAAWTQQIQGVAKTLKTTTYPELKAFVEHMEEFGNIGKGLALKKCHWWYMNDWLDNLFAKYDDNNYITRSMYVQGSTEAFKATLKYPLSRMGKLNAISLAMTTQKDKYLSIDEDEFQNHPITKIADQLPVADWHLIDEYAIAFRERALGKEYEEPYNKALKAFEPIKDRKYNISEDGISKPKTASEIVMRLQDLYTAHSKKIWQTTVANDQAIERYLLPHMYFIEDNQVRRYTDLKNKKVDLSIGIMDIDRVMSLLAGRVLSQGDMPFLGIKGKDLIYHQWQIQNKEFNGQKIEGMDSKYKWINLKIADRVKDLNRKLSFEHEVDTQVIDSEGTEYMVKQKNRPFKYLEFNGFDAGLESRFYEYFPHRDIPQAEREAAMKRELDKANANGDKEASIAIQLKYKLEYGKDLSEDGLATQDMLGSLENLITEDTIAGRGVRRASNLQRRDLKEPLMGYNRSWKVFKDYKRTLTSEYWNGMSALVGHYNVDNFIKETKASKNNVGVENLDPWVNFMRTSIRTSLGYPAIFPQEWANDPKFKIKGNPYRVMTEDYWINKATIMDKWFGITPEMRTKYEASDIANKTTHFVDPWRNVRQAAITRKLSALTNFEAKMSMMSLLFSPKTYLANIGTASINTGISAGWDYWKEAGNISYLQTINPKWTSMDAITVDIDKLGGIESFIKNEVPLSQKFKAANAQRFLERSLEVLRKDKNTKDITLREIARQEGLSQDFVDKSAYFMRSSERIARRRAWIAHYLKARNLFEASHMSYKWDDPLLIEMANRGVYATQFLYSNAARPQFARTALGKIFSRFQLFTYNSIKWRADLTKQAMAMGYSKNSPEMDRFTRMASADVFVMALATLLPYSIFNNALPPPYNHLQGMAAWLFGDKEDKEKSFFGVLPYPANIIQPILPPSSRYITPIIGMLATGDTERFAQYHVWTWMPFGRFLNDTRKSLENPYLLPERSFGIPFNSFRDRFLGKEKD
jgi:hypothetical protein